MIDCRCYIHYNDYSYNSYNQLIGKYMLNVSAKEAQNHFGELMIKAIKEPVIINKYGKPSAVLMSHEEYERFSSIEDLYWEMEAKKASLNGFLSKEESQDFLNKILKG